MSNNNEIKKRACECGEVYVGNAKGCDACKKAYAELGGGGKRKKNLFTGKRQHMTGTGTPKDWDLIREGAEPIAGGSLSILEQWLSGGVKI